MTSPKKKPGQANKDEILLILRGFVPADMIAVEHRFHPVRMWRFDYCLPSKMIAVEYHGHAGFVGKGVSGHSTIKGLTNDCEKLNSAQAAGWTVLAFTALHFKPADRAKHKLTSPYETIKAAFEAAKIRQSESQPTLF
jgi:hypothetical protein